MKKKIIALLIIIFTIFLLSADKALAFRYKLKSIDTTLKRIGYEYTGFKKGKNKGDVDYIWKHSKRGVKVIVKGKLIVDTALKIEFDYTSDDQSRIAAQTLGNLLLMNLAQKADKKQIAKMVSRCTMCKIRRNPDCWCHIKLQDFKLSYSVAPRTSKIAAYILESKWVLPFDEEFN